MGVPRYRLLIAYDGTEFYGWQKQEPVARPVFTATPGAASASAPPATPDPGARRHSPPAYNEHTRLIASTRDGRVALRTVQGVVEEAVRAVVREPVELIGASRTDSGVHARGQVAAFTCEPLDPNPESLRARLEAHQLSARGVGDGFPIADDPTLTHDPAVHVSLSVGTARAAPAPVASKARTGWPADRGVERLCAAINSRLPSDVLVCAVERADPDFDPVKGAVRKAYTYTWHVGRERPLWDAGRVTHVFNTKTLDVVAMNAAAAMLVGEHDFNAFASLGHQRLSTVRTVFRCEVRELDTEAPDTRAAVGVMTPDPASRPRRYRLHIEGSGFLWNMVRIIAGTLLEVGQGRRPPTDVRAILASGDRTRAGPTAPAQGLCLEWIEYAGGVSPH